MADPSMRFLARLAEVSQSTVSRALRDDPRISLVTRRRIQKLAAEHGYRFDPRVAELMQSLRGKRSATGHVLAWLDLQDDPKIWQNNPYIRPFWNGAAERAGKLGYGLDIIRLVDFRNDRKSLDKVLKSRGIRGVILGGLCKADLQVPLDWKHYAAVKWTLNPEYPLIDAVYTDGFGLYVEGLRKIAALGYRKIGFVQNFFNVVEPRMKVSCEAAIAEFNGYRANSSSPEVRVDALYFPGITSDNKSQFLAWFQKNKPEALFVNFRDVLDWLPELGEIPGKTIGLAHVNAGIQLPEENWAGTNTNAEVIGSTLVDMLTGKLLRNDFGPPLIHTLTMVSSSWMDGQTLPQR